MASDVAPVKSDWRARISANLKRASAQRIRALFAEINPGLVGDRLFEDRWSDVRKDAAVLVPIIDRLEGAENQKLEGKKICIEMLQHVREMKGVSGAHVMAYRQEELVAEIVHESGILKGRRPWTRENNPDYEAVAEAIETVKDQSEHPIDPEEAVAAAFEEH